MFKSEERRPKFIPGYKVAVFEPVDVASLMTVVQGKLAITAEQSVQQTKLVDCAGLWAAVEEYDKFVSEIEQEWSNAKRIRQQNSQYSGYHNQQPPQPPSVDPIATAKAIKERAFTILNKIIDELCAVVNTAGTLGKFKSNLVASFEATDLCEEVQFEDGKYMNSGHFPTLKKSLLSELNSKLKDASAVVHEELENSLTAFAAKRLNFKVPKHSIVNRQHFNDIKWNEEGEVYAHLLIDEWHQGFYPLHCNL